MSITLSSERKIFHAERKGDSVMLSGEVTINEDGKVQSFNGTVKPAVESASDPAMAYGSFYYQLNGNRINKNTDVLAAYDKEVHELLYLSVSEIEKQTKEEE